jgi:epoxide hydrolase-like predicted phosphatase
MEKNMIKAVIFDVGGVIVRSGTRQGRRKWEDRLGLNEWESEDIVFNSDMGTKAQKGEISDEDLWNWVKKRFELSDDDFAEFTIDFWADNQVDQEMMVMIRKLRPAYTTAIISNATDTMRQDLDERYHIDDAFDLIVCSAEEKIMKPDPEIFLKTLNRLQVKPSESVFIDDMKSNADAARELGMKAIHYTPAIDLAAELRKFGVMIGG